MPLCCKQTIGDIKLLCPARQIARFCVAPNSIPPHKPMCIRLGGGDGFDNGLCGTYEIRHSANFLATFRMRNDKPARLFLAECADMLAKHLMHRTKTLPQYNLRRRISSGDKPPSGKSKSQTTNLRHSGNSHRARRPSAKMLVGEK